MKRITFSLLLVLFSCVGFSQDGISDVLKKYNSESIPYISVQELALAKTAVILLDAREISEYNVSHIQDAIYVGYDDFDPTTVAKNITDKSSKIVVYCSLGVRSEDIAEDLKKEGFTNIYNLFGGIFEWKNKDFTVYNNDEEPTENVHAFSAAWSQWLLKGIKIYD
jgi:rhodanese-related sulfurtransferase